MKIIRGIEQGSPEWFQCKLGKAGGSKFDVVLTKGRGKEEFGATFLTYAHELAMQIHTGEFPETYKSDAMQRGNDKEPNAANRYVIETGNLVEEITGFDMGRNAFVSPDRIIGNVVGGLEIKNPNTKTHLGYIKAGILPKTYKPQTQGCMWAADCEWWDFMSYDDRLEHGQVFLIREYRDDEYIKNLESRINLLGKVRDDIVSDLIALKDYDFRIGYNKSIRV